MHDLPSLGHLLPSCDYIQYSALGGVSDTSSQTTIAVLRDHKLVTSANAFNSIIGIRRGNHTCFYRGPVADLCGEKRPRDSRKRKNKTDQASNGSLTSGHYYLSKNASGDKVQFSGKNKRSWQSAPGSANGALAATLNERFLRIVNLSIFTIPEIILPKSTEKCCE